MPRPRIGMGQSRLYGAATMIHYEWELTDANGEWQASGSANFYLDVYNEAMRYLTQYAPSGKHTITIKKRKTTTVLVGSAGRDVGEVKP